MMVESLSRYLVRVFFIIHNLPVTFSMYVYIHLSLVRTLEIIKQDLMNAFVAFIHISVLQMER